MWQRAGMDLTFREIGNRLNIAPSTVHAIYKLFEEKGDVAANKQPSRPHSRRLDVHQEVLILSMIMECPTMYLHELCREVDKVSQVTVSEATVCRVLRRNGLTRKKVRQVALQRSLVERGLFMALVLAFPREMFVFVDESGSDRRNDIRKFGYSPRGERTECYHFLSRGKRVSAIVALSCTGIIGIDFTCGSVDGDMFCDVVRGILIPSMKPFDGTSETSIAIMDKCSIHHVDAVAKLSEDAGVLLLFLPAYSPDLNPIEEAFSYVKSYLKRHDDILQSVPDPIPIIRTTYQFNIILGLTHQ